MTVTVDTAARPAWRRTGYLYFPYAAVVSGTCWVLRLNVGFPEHDRYTIFVDGRAAADVTGDPDSDTPLVASVGVLGHDADVPTLEPDVARRVVSVVAHFADYGSEVGDVCVWCGNDRDGFTPSQ